MTPLKAIAIIYGALAVALLVAYFGQDEGGQ
jgi:hypothetical protein